jgi:hypothetical protein
MTDWSVRLEIEAPITTPEAFELSDALQDHAAVISGGDTQDFGVRLSVEAETAPDAVSRAAKLVRAAVDRVGIPVGTIERAEAVTMDRLAAENRGLEGELYVGISDIAREHGFSRQRAHELTQLPGFPEPIASTSAGRVWRFSDVERFLAKPRPAGRPRKSPAGVGSEIRATDGVVIDKTVRGVSGKVLTGKLGTVRDVSNTRMSPRAPRRRAAARMAAKRARPRRPARRR